MCSNFIPTSDVDRLRRHFGVELPDNAVTAGQLVRPLRSAPIIVGSTERPSIVSGIFGFVPHFAKILGYGRRAYAMATNQIDAGGTFVRAWRRGQRCIIPADFVIEHFQGGDIRGRYAVHSSDGAPLGLAGLFNKWRDPSDGNEHMTFAVVTAEAGEHPPFCASGSSVRPAVMPVILDEEARRRWLSEDLPDPLAVCVSARPPTDLTVSPQVHHFSASSQA